METTNKRRSFLKSTGILGAGLLMPSLSFGQPSRPIKEGNIHEFGKRTGYTNEVSILVSMMDWMRATILRGVQNINQKELDFLLDDASNSIGAMLMHLAGTERYYQIDTFKGISKKELSFGITDEMWDAASSLGDKGRVTFKDNSPSFYLDKLAEVREFSLKELKNRDDAWLYESTKFFGNQPTNNYCKWFHVVEHESNHNGQIRIIKKRVV
ncbi:MAG: DinB family protein [Maribacter sp.]